MQTKEYLKIEERMKELGLREQDKVEMTEGYMFTLESYSLRFENPERVVRVFADYDGAPISPEVFEIIGDLRKLFGWDNDDYKYECTVD